MEPSFQPLRRFVSGNKLASEITAANLNQSVEALDELRKDAVANRTTQKLGDLPVIKSVLGMITFKGPSDEADDTTKPIYWIRPQRVTKNTYDQKALELESDLTPGIGDKIRATNLCEPLGSHALDTDDSEYVHCFCVSFDGYPPTDHWFFFREPPALRYGKIQTVSDCNTYSIVKRCDSTGTVIYSDTLITVLPTKGGADATENGFVLNVGDVIAYLPSPNDSLVGYQIGAYKTVSVGYRCSDTNSASIPGLNRMTFFNSDFLIVPSSDCGGTYTNQANIFWTGNYVKGGYGGTLTANVKVWDFDTNHPGPISYSGTSGTDARIGFDVTYATTQAHLQNVGGGPCPDEVSAKIASIIGFLPTGTAIATIDGATGVCNTNTGGIDITINYSTMRVVIPFPF